MTLKDDCVECVNFEFSADSLWLNHDEPKVFVQSQVCLLFISVLMTEWQKCLWMPKWFSVIPILAYAECNIQ